MVHDRGRGGLQARAAGHARRAAGADRRRVDPPAADAQALQDPHGPRDGGRHRRARHGRRRGGRAGRARASSPTTTSTSPSSARRRATCRSCREPYAAGRRASSASPSTQLLEHLRGHGRARAAAPRRGDPLPPPRRLQRQRHGRLAGARRQDRRDRPADGRVPRDQPLLPAPDLRGLAATRSSRWPTAAPRRSATRSSTRSRPRSPDIQDRATLYSSTEFKKIRLLYFTDDFTHLGSASTPASERRAPRSRTPERRALRARRQRACPAASTRPCARCARSAATRSSSSAPRAPELVDVDGNRYVDWVCSWGPLIHGHAHPAILAAVGEAAAARGRRSARRPPARSSSPRRSRGGCRRSRCCG